MASYKLVWKHSARKELKKLDKRMISKIIEVIKVLTDNPHPSGSKKLQGTEHIYRLRVGDYRVVYSIQSSVLVIEIIRIAHRKEIYRRIS